MNRKDGVQTMTSTAAGNSRTALISELLKELTRRERLVLALRYTEELTVLEIAAVMEIAVTEVERMLDSISERVRRRLAPMYGRPRLA
jgi:DNA-directed RNA polymerase specialized sigma subunit